MDRELEGAIERCVQRVLSEQNAAMTARLDSIQATLQSLQLLMAQQQPAQTQASAVPPKKLGAEAPSKRQEETSQSSDRKVYPDTTSEISGPIMTVRPAWEDDGQKSRVALTRHQTVLGPPEWSTPRWLEQLVAASWFEMLWVGIVFVNAIVLGIQVEMNAQNPSDDVPTVFVTLGAVFALLFLLELLLRFLASGGIRRFLWESEDRGWNIFDTLVVIAGGFDSLVEIVAYGADVQEWRVLAGTRLFRMVRVLRLTRAIRILKVVRHIGPLRTLIRSTTSIIQHIFWAVVLIVMVMYIMGLIFTDAVTVFVQDTLIPQNISVANFGNGQLVYFSSGLHYSIQTCFWAITGGIDYADAINALKLIDGGWFWGYLFELYLAFMILGAMNVMTGVVCETAIDFAEKEAQHELALTAMDRKHAQLAMEKLSEQLRTCQADDASAFDRLMEDPWFKKFLEGIGCQRQEAGMTLFQRLFDGDGNGKVDLDEFVEGCLQLKNPAKAFDVAAMKVDITRMGKVLDEIQGAQELLVQRLLPRATELHLQEEGSCGVAGPT